MIQPRTGWTRRRWLKGSLLVAGGGVLAACSPAAPVAPTAAPAKAAVAVQPAPTSAPAASATAVATTAPAVKTGSLTKVAVLNGGQVIGWAPAYLALGKGFFRDEGLDVEYTTSAQGAPAAVAAVVGGSAFMAFTGAPVAVNAAKQGSPVRIMLVAASEYGAELTASTKLLAAKGVTPQSPLEQKVNALKGAKVAIDSPGDSNDQLLRFLCRQFNLNPETDLEIVSLQSIPNKMAGLQRGSVDLMIASPPSGLQTEGQGYGKVFIKPSEVPQLKGYPYLVGSGNPKDFQERPEVVKGVIKGMARAEKLLRTDAAAAKPVVQKAFENFDPQVFDLAYDAMLAAVPTSPAPTRAQFTALETFANLQGKPLGITYEQAFDARAAEAAVKELGG